MSLPATIDTILIRARAEATASTLLTSLRWWRTKQQHWDRETLTLMCRGEVSALCDALRLQGARS